MKHLIKILILLLIPTGSFAHNMLMLDADADSAMHLVMSGKMRETIHFPKVDLTSVICLVRFCLSSWYATRGRKKSVPEVEVEVEVRISEFQLRPRLVTKRSHKNGRSAGEVEVDVEVDVEGEVEVKISELQ